MAPQRELDVKRHFDNNSELEVTLVDSTGESFEKVFYDEYNAIQEINNLECEFDVYF